MPIEIGGSAGGVSGINIPIDSIMPMNCADNTMVMGTQTWLKSGFTSTDTVTYPDAYTSPSGEITLSVVDTWLTTGQAIPESLHMQNGKVFTSGYNIGEPNLKEWELDGTATGRTLDTGFIVVGACNNMHGGIWLNDRTPNILREYDETTLVATGRTLDFSAKSTNVQSLSVLDGVLNLLDSGTGVLHRYDETTLVFIDSLTRSGAGGSTLALGGLTRVAGKWLVIEYGTGIIYRYDDNFVYDNYKLDITPVAAGVNWTGLMYHDFKVYCLNYVTQTVHVLPSTASEIGLSVAKTDLDSGLPLYVRVK